MANPCYARNVSGGINSPPINKGDHLFMQKWKLTVDPLCVDHQSGPPGSTEAITFSCKSESWLLILSALIVNPPGSTEAITFSHESESWLLILSASIVNSPPGSTEVITFSCESESWLLILSASVVNPPQDQQRWSPLCVDHWLPPHRLSIDPPTFLIFNIKILKLFPQKVTAYLLFTLTTIVSIFNVQLGMLSHTVIHKSATLCHISKDQTPLHISQISLIPND